MRTQRQRLRVLVPLVLALALAVALVVPLLPSSAPGIAPPYIPFPLPPPRADGIIPPYVPPSNAPPAHSGACWKAIINPPGRHIRSFAKPSPNNPNCITHWESVTDIARATEGVKPLGLPTNWTSLTLAERLFVIINLERTARGIPPFVGLSRVLNQDALQGARRNNDPPPKLSYPGIQVAVDPNGYWYGPDSIVNDDGEFVGPFSETGIWAGGYGSVLAANYGWMYRDGWKSSNTDCTSAISGGCWGHRWAILGQITGTKCTYCIAGAAVVTERWPHSTDEALSLAAIFVRPSAATPHPPLVFTWAQEEPYLPAWERGPAYRPSSPSMSDGGIR